MNEISKEDSYAYASYINSKDIRDYLREIGYSFSAQEVAWLIWQCKHLTLKEKHDAWKNLMNRGYLDRETPLVLTLNREPQKLWDFLCSYMELEKEWLDVFRNSERSVYHYSIRLTQKDDTYEYIDDKNVFSTYDNCIEAAKKEIADYDDQEKKNLKVRITKRRIDSTDGPYHAMNVILDRHFSIFEVDVDGAPEEDSYTHDTFEDMWFDFPLPFKKGDIIYDTTRSEDAFLCGAMVYVESAHDRYVERGRRGCDTSDMWIEGYFQCEDGAVFGETGYNYMDYEYYPPEKLTGKKRVLPIISRYLKDEIGLCCMNNTYHQILLEEMAADSNPCSKVML